MSTKHYSISIFDRRRSIPEFVNALNDKYGSQNITIYRNNQYATSGSLIFLCPQISSKVIKILFTSPVVISYGDAWTSYDNITNEVTVGPGSVSNGGGRSQDIHLFLSDKFIMVFIGCSLSVAHLLIVGKATNDDSVCLSLTYATLTSSVTQYNGRNITAGNYIFPIGLPTAMRGSDGEIYRMPLRFINTANKMVLNSSGVLIGIDGIYSVGIDMPLSKYVVGNNFFISPSELIGYYYAGGNPRLKMPIYIEFE